MDTQNTESLSSRIITSGQHRVYFLFNDSRWDAEIIPMGQGIPDEQVQADYRARGLRLVGCAGFVNGRLCTSWEPPIVGDNVVDFLGRAYTEWLYRTEVAEAPNKMQADAGIEWLKALHSLPDPREAN